MDLVQQYSDRCTLSCSNVIFIYSLHRVCQHSVLSFPLNTVSGCIENRWYEAVWAFSALVDECRCSTVKWYCYWLSLAFHGTAIDCQLLFMVLRLTVTCFSMVLLLTVTFHCAAIYYHFFSLYCDWLSLAFDGTAIDCHLFFMVLRLTVTCFWWYCDWLSLAFHGTAIDCHLFCMVPRMTVTCISWYCDWLSLAFHGTAIDCHFSWCCDWL